MTRRPVVKFPLLFVFALVLALASCKSTRDLPKAEARAISTNKLLKRVEKNAFYYDSFAIKRIMCSFSSSSSKANFKISLKALKDEKILVSIQKLNIPVGRVLLTPDSVKYVNYIDRNYFVDDYTYLSRFLNIDIDFATIQSIISNNAFSYRNDPKNRDFRTFDSFIENDLYVLQSEKTRKLYKLNENAKPQKVERRLKRLNDAALILQKMYFEPDNFNLLKVQINDKTNERYMNLAFDDFKKLDNKDYPGAIEMNFLSDKENISLKLRMSGFSTEKIENISINIPEKYEQIRIN
jgi:hypothetical protein